MGHLIVGFGQNLTRFDQNWPIWPIWSDLPDQGVRVELLIEAPVGGWRRRSSLRSSTRPRASRADWLLIG